jgi:hypothetical protein
VVAFVILACSLVLRFVGVVAEKVPSRCGIFAADRLRQSKNATDLSEWKDLGAIMDAICSTFDVTDREALLELASNAEIDNENSETGGRHQR